MSLPCLFFIRAQVRNDSRPEEARYCLVSATSIYSPENGTMWKTKIVEGSKHLVSGATLRHDGLETEPVNIWHERDTTHHSSGVVYYESKVWRTKNYIFLLGHGQISEYKMTHANKALPSVYNHVGKCRDGCKRWHFTLSDLAGQAAVPVVTPAVTPAVTNAKIPTHVFHAFVDLAISKREECPVSMEALTRENVGCPPCGHLFEKESLRRALADRGVCPTCRMKAGVDDIQSW
jgi:hypothetical protein